MERGVATASDKVWTGIVIALGVAVVGTVVGGIILLVIEYKSGYFNSTPPAPMEQTPESNNRPLTVKAAPELIPKEVPQVRLKPEIKAEPPKQPEPKEPKAAKPEPPFVDVTLEHFADTYASLGEKDRSTYLQSLARKRVTWTGYIMQIYLADNYLYLSDKKGGHTALNVGVGFKDAMRLNVGPLKAKIRVSGPVEIRGQWVFIDATELTVVR